MLHLCTFVLHVVHVLINVIMMTKSGHGTLSLSTMHIVMDRPVKSHAFRVRLMHVRSISRSHAYG